MTLLAPSHNSLLFGHDEAMRQFAAAYASGRMHHAWLMTGVEGVGKATLAWHMAHYVLSGGKNPLGKLDMQHPVARLVAGEAHPDLFVLRRPVDDKTGAMKDVIPAEDARKLAPFLHKTATHGGWRVAIIDEAHALNRFGQNAILKVIEEPPRKCLILITTTTAGALLPTIRSRCRVLPLRPLDDQALRTVLGHCGLEAGQEADFGPAIRLAGGSAGFAVKILQTECLPLYEEMLEILGKLPALDMARLHGLADRIGRKADRDSFGIVTTLLNDHLRQKAKEEASQGGYRLDRALRLWDKVGHIFAQAADANLDHKLAFVNAVAAIRHAAA